MIHNFNERMTDNEALPEQADQYHGSAVEYACSIVADVFGNPPHVRPRTVQCSGKRLSDIHWFHSSIVQKICLFLFKNGPSTLREVGMGTELPKSVVTKGLMVLITHSLIEALLHDQVGQNRQIVSNTVYKVCILFVSPIYDVHY